MGYFGAYFGGASAGTSIPTIADGPTTFETIRDAQMSVIEALTPTKHAGHPFRRHRDAVDFMAWVEANPKSCFRRFEILANDDLETSPTSDGFQEFWTHTEEIRVAYSLEYGKYGAENARDLQDAIEADQRAIDGAIGRHGIFNYVAGQQNSQRQTKQEIEVEGPKGKARVLAITFLVQYDRSV